MKRVLCIVAAAFVSGCLFDGASNAPEANTGATPKEPPLKVAVYAGKGPSGIGAAEWYRIVRDSPQMDLKLVDSAAVRSGGRVLTASAANTPEGGEACSSLDEMVGRLEALRR